MDLRIWIIGAFLIIANNVIADTLIDAENGYALAAAPGWSFDAENQNFNGPSGEILSSLNLPSESVKSIDQVQSVAGAIVMMGLGYTETTEKFKSKGDNWKGKCIVMIAPASERRAEKRVIQLIVKSGALYKAFYLQVTPVQWTENKKMYKNVLKNIVFPYDS